MVAQMVENLPALQETQAQYLGLEDLLKKGMVTHSSILSAPHQKKSPKDFPGGSDGKACVYNVGDPGSIPGLGRSPGEGHGYPPTPVFLPGESHGQRSLVGYCP